MRNQVDMDTELTTPGTVLRPVLTVPLLLRTDRQEEGDGHQNKDGTLGCGHLRGLLLMPVAQKNKTLLVQLYHESWVMSEAWLVDLAPTEYGDFIAMTRHGSVTRRCSWTVGL